MAWYFLRVPGCRAFNAVKKFKRQVAQLGRVYECDHGTEIDPTAGWYTVNIGEKEVPGVRERLKALGISERVDHIEPLSRPIDGRSISKQLALF